MNASLTHAPERDDAERALGIDRRGRKAASRPVEDDGDEVAATALWLGLTLFIAVAARLLMFVLGPAGQLTRALENPPDVSPADSTATHLVAIAPTETGLPGYDALLAAVQAMGLPLSSVLLLQIVLGAAAAGLVYGIALALFQQRMPAALAAAIMALHPAGIVAANTFAPDVILVTLLLLGIYFAAHRSCDFTSSLLGGLSLGLAALVRPISLLLGAGIALWTALRSRRLAGLGAAVTLAAASAAPPAAYMIYSGTGPSSWPGGMQHPVQPIMQAAADPHATLHRASDLYTGHGVEDLYLRLGIAAPSPQLPANPTDAATMRTWAESAATADYLALVWTAGNSLLLVGSVVGLVLLVIRRQLTAALLLGGMMGYCLLAWPGTEAARWHLPALGLQAIALSTILVRVPRTARRPLRLWFKRKPKPTPEQEEAAQVIPLLTGRPL